MGEPNATANSDQQKPQTEISRRSPDKVGDPPSGHRWLMGASLLALEIAEHLNWTKPLPALTDGAVCFQRPDGTTNCKLGRGNYTMNVEMWACWKVVTRVMNALFPVFLFFFYLKLNAGHNYLVKKSKLGNGTKIAHFGSPGQLKLFMQPFSNIFLSKLLWLRNM